MNDDDYVNVNDYLENPEKYARQQRVPRTPGTLDIIGFRFFWFGVGIVILAILGECT